MAGRLRPKSRRSPAAGRPTFVFPSRGRGGGAPGAASPSANAPARSGRLARLAAGAPKPEGPVCLLPLWPLFKPGPSRPKLAICSVFLRSACDEVRRNRFNIDMPAAPINCVLPSVLQAASPGTV